MKKYILIGILVMLVMLGVSSYNAIIEDGINADSKYSHIETQIQRKADLMPSLVFTVNKYVKHEEKIMKEVIEARALLAGAVKPEETITASNNLNTALGKLLAIAEDYPDLKANTQFTELMRELSGSENRIAIARKDYNDAVQAYNVDIQTFPGNIFANIMGFRSKPLFKAEEAAKEKIQFSF